MKRNKNKLIGAIRFLTKVKKCLLMFLFANLTIFGTLIAQTPQIWPTEITFNYDANSNTYDALNIRKNASTTISVPEYVKDSRNESCAYIMSQSSRKIKVKFNSNNSNMNYLVKATVISGTGIGNICEIFVAPCDLNSTVFTIELSGSIPSSVGKRTFTWKWEATALPINSPYCPITCTSVNTTHTYYTLLAIPQAPMNTPWTDVLDYACVWASGQLSEYSVIMFITEGAYNNIGKEYWGGGSHAVFPNFDLTGFFSDNWVDCRDMSAVVQIFSNALGVQGIQVRRINGQFVYKPILPVGKSSWVSGTWNFHQVGYYCNVFDACLKLNQTSPRIPINEPINGSYKNDLFSSGYWSPIDAATYTYVY